LAITVVDGAPTGARTFTVKAKGGSTKSGKVTFVVNPAAGQAAITLTPTSVSMEEGSSSNPVTISIGSATTVDTIIALSSSDAQLAQVPAAVTIAAGQTTNTFQVK